MQLPSWSFHSSNQGSRVTWIQLAFEFLAQFGFQPGWLLPTMTAGILASRFRSVFLKFTKANNIAVELASHCRNLRAFGLPNQSGFFGSVCYSSFLHQLYIFCQANKFFATNLLLPNQKPRAHWKPDFLNFSSIQCFSPAYAAGVS